MNARRMMGMGGTALVAACVGLSAAEPPLPVVPPPTNDVFVEYHVPVAMRDGVILDADVYRPVGQGPFPVIVSRTPYSKARYATIRYRTPEAYKEMLFFARHGYVAVLQDIRGRYDSDGHWEPFRNDIQDGYDTIEWAARQPWSTGKVGMQGISYLGTAQWLTAMSSPPHLVTIVPVVASTSLYHDWVTSNGAWRLDFNLAWGSMRMDSRVEGNIGIYRDADAPPSLRYADVERHLPLVTLQKAAGRNASFFQDWIAHPDYDAYWKAVDVEESFGRIGIPVLDIGGWFDLFRQGTVHGYLGMRAKGKTAAARTGTHLIIGPWGHWPSRSTGALDFGRTALLDDGPIPPEETLALDQAFALEWFEHWLKGVDNGVDRRPPVRIFVMGLNQWRDEDDFPPARVRYRKLYFHSAGQAGARGGGGRLSPSPAGGDETPDRYVYDPNDPARDPGPAMDLRTLEGRSDVLVYTSEALAKDLEIIGPLKVVLQAASDAPDTDFVARLADVYPDGRVIGMAEGILRARYRQSTSRPSPLEPGKVYPLTIDLTGLAMQFPKGHRLRVEITSSDYPTFDRNPNTALPFGMSAEVRKATQSIHHSARHPSCIVLPVTDGESALGIQ